MDHLALALKKAAKMVESDFLQKAVANRYSGWSGDLGKSIAAGEHSLESLASHATSNGINPKHASGKQELLENQVNRVLFG